MIRLFIAALALVATGAAQAGFLENPKTAQLHQKLVQDYQFQAKDLELVDALLSVAQEMPSLVAEEKNNKEVTTPLWDHYRAIHVFPKQVTNGQKVLGQHAAWFSKAERQFGVPSVVIAAILGVETKYGGYTGRVRVLDALATQGYLHPTRSAFFFDELAAFFALCKKHGLDAREVRGSYAGAMGYAQFMPSNYLNLALDYDGDGKVNLWSMPDAIGSIAHYFTKYVPPSGNKAFWQPGQPLLSPVRITNLSGSAPEVNSKRPSATVGDWTGYGAEALADLPPATPASLLELRRPDGPEYWLALPNFYSVMSYNPRVFYAMAVTELAAELQQAGSTH